VTGPALENLPVVTRIAKLIIWLVHRCDVARSRRQRMRLAVAVSALRNVLNVLRVMRLIAVGTRLFAVYPPIIVGSRRDKRIVRSVTG
jgi:hypothetical protein